MNHHSGITKSVWMADYAVPNFPNLRSDEEADVCIVGAGIAGLTTGFLLARAGRSVLILDDGPIASGETERTTAHLASALDDRFVELERLHGAEGARLAAESHSAAIDWIERFVADEQVDCDFSRVDGYLFLAPDSPSDLLKKELEAARKAGLRVEWAERAPLGSLFDTGPALRFLNQAQFNPMPYMSALARAFIREGGRIRTHTHATRIRGGRQATIETVRGPIVTANDVIVATGSPVNDVVLIHTKQAAYRTYVIALEVPSGSVPKSLFWDTGDPYHYVRIQPASANAPLGALQDLLIVGGEDHKTGQANDAEVRFSRLEDWTRECFPSAGSIRYRWSGQIMEPVDNLGFIGRNPTDRNVWIVTGDSGNGMTNGTLAGILLSEELQGKSNPWAALYDPGRIRIKAGGEFAHENLNAAAQYGGWASSGDVKDMSEMKPDTGAVIRHGVSKQAVYCSEKMECQACSAVCTHLKGIVAWNALEKSFDCPAHGSRFDAYGEVTNGPAIKNLKKVLQREPAGTVK